MTRERQNADELGSSGLEVEGDVRPHPRVTVPLFGAFTSAHYTNTPKQPAIQDNRVPQVPRYHIGAGVIAEARHVATFSVQARFVGDQYEDDLNLLVLENYAVVDASATRPLARPVQLYLGVENLFDVEYDIGRTQRQVDRLATDRPCGDQGVPAVVSRERQQPDASRESAARSPAIPLQTIQNESDHQRCSPETITATAHRGRLNQPRWLAIR